MTATATKKRMQVLTTRLGDWSAIEDEDTPFLDDEMSPGEKRILCTLVEKSEPLPYPLKTLEMAKGPAEQVYDIPEEDKAALLPTLYPFTPCPDLDDEIFDLHEETLFRFREAQVIRYRDRNLLVSPHYAHSGGMTVDFLPKGSATQKQSVCIQAIKE